MINVSLQTNCSKKIIISYNFIHSIFALMFHIWSKMNSDLEDVNKQYHPVFSQGGALLSVFTKIAVSPLDVYSNKIKSFLITL